MVRTSVCLQHNAQTVPTYSTWSAGIVTRFDLATIPVHTVYVEILVYAAVETPAVLRALAAWQSGTGASDVRGTILAVSSLSGTTVGFVYSQPAARRPDAFAAFSDIPVLQTALPPTNLSCLRLMEIAATLVNEGPQRHDYRAMSTHIDGDLYVAMFNFWAERAAAVHDKTGATQTFVLQPITRNLIQQGIDKGGNALGLAPSSMSCKHWSPISTRSLSTVHCVRINLISFLNRVDHPYRLAGRGRRRDRPQCVHRHHERVEEAVSSEVSVYE